VSENNETVIYIFRPSGTIVEDILLDELGDAPCPALPKPSYLSRTANYHRQKLRPDDPATMDFELALEHIPEGFFRKDIEVIFVM